MNLAKASDLRKIAVCFTVILLGIVLGWREIGKHWHSWCLWPEESQTSASFTEERRIYQDDIQVGEIDSNCGLPEACSHDSFPLSLSTGHPDDRLPHLCIGGRVVIQKNVNGGGRGLNAAIIDPVQFQIVAVRNFDTYRFDSASDLDLWLEEIVTNDILIVFTNDEASTKLNQSTKTLLNGLGSGQVQDLSYRAQWFLITQKAGKGFSIYEKISFPRNRSWGDTLVWNGCVPRIVPKKWHTVDPPPKENIARSKFCMEKTGDEYQAFCTQSRFESFLPALMTNRSLIGNRVLSVPIYLFVGEEFEIVLAALDSILHQPGVLLPAVNVIYNTSRKDIEDLINLFGMTPLGNSVALTWQEMIAYARNDTAIMHPSQSYFIVVAPDTIPSPDFLFYLAQTSFALFRDSTLSAVSAWSPNCYNSPGDGHLAFRVHGSAKYAALISVRDIKGDVIVPDVSRVQGPEACHPPSLKQDNWIERPQDLVHDRYFHKLVMLQQRSQPLNVIQVLNDCMMYNFSENTSYVMYFNGTEPVLSSLLTCLGIQKRIFGEYQKIIRVTVVSSSYVLIIKSESTFYKARPIGQ